MNTVTTADLRNHFRRVSSWLVQPGVELPTSLIALKIRDHHRETSEFITSLKDRANALKTQPTYREDFMKEMRRFLPAAAVRDTVEKEAWWRYLTQVIGEQAAKALKVV